jgi:hypothetical protein
LDVENDFDLHKFALRFNMSISSSSSSSSLTDVVESWICSFCSFDENSRENKKCLKCSKARVNPRKRKLNEIGEDTVRWAKETFELFRNGKLSEFDKEFFIYFMCRHRFSVRKIIFEFHILICKIINSFSRFAALVDEMKDFSFPDHFVFFMLSYCSKIYTDTDVFAVKTKLRSLPVFTSYLIQVGFPFWI